MPPLDFIATAYPRAEIATAMVHDRRSDAYLIVYGVAELCPADQPTSSLIGKPPHFMLRERIDGQDASLYVRRDLVDSAAAIAFFRGADGSRSLPGAPTLKSAGPLVDVTSNEEAVLIPSNLGEASGVGAVLPPRQTALGLLSKYDTGGATTRTLGEPAMSRVREVVRAALGVDLTRFAEHVGAVHLCFTNPILRRFERTLGADGRTLLVRCYERMGRSISGCDVELTNEWQPLGTGFCLRQRIVAPFFTVALPAPPHSLRVRLFDTSGRCIEDESAVFIKKIGLDLAMTSRRRVILPGSDGRQEVHDVQTVSRERRARIEEEALPSPLVAIGEAQRRRQLDELAAERVFLYFPGGDNSKRDARKVVRELLGQARGRCDIVDPYLSADDAAMFVPFIATTGCKVRLLSSHAFLRQSVDGEARLVARVAELKVLPLVLEARRMEGRERSPVHDRVLVVDDTLYLLGSSLSELGSRATTIFRVPDARQMLSEIERWWAEALPLGAPEPATKGDAA